MRDKYYPPVELEKAFHCYHCGVFCEQRWSTIYKSVSAVSKDSGIRRCVCFHCGTESYWYQKRMIIPAASFAEPAHPDLPDNCVTDYLEAASVVSISPRSAAALLRLCIQKLMPHLGEKGKNINDDVASLVSKGLPIIAQQALDYCRVVGNNAVHPGEINLNDTPEIAHQLFSMINFIVQDRITRPKEIGEFYNSLPQNARDAIEKRDKKP